MLSHTFLLTNSLPCAVLTPKIFLLSVWPLPRSLATTYGISVDFSSSPYLDVSVQAVPHICLFYSAYVDRVLLCRVAPFGYPRIYRLLTAPRGFSQLTASFIGSQCQGILLALLLAWPLCDTLCSHSRNFSNFYYPFLTYTAFFQRRILYMPISRLSYFTFFVQFSRYIASLNSFLNSDFNT